MTDAKHEAPAEGAGERVYIDCEFDGHNGPLLSVALVREGGDSIHIRADAEPMDLWVRQNVLPLMDSHKAARSEKVYAYEVGGVIRSFLGEGSPVIVCDSPQDARYFSQALTTAPDGGYAPFTLDGLTIEVHGVDAYPTTLEGAVQHNAWWDAMALREALRARSSAPEAREEALGNLLAVIHGDGGHRALEVGTKQAALEAEKIVAGLFAAPSADKLRIAVEALEHIADEAPYRSGYCQSDVDYAPKLSDKEMQAVAQAALSSIEAEGA